MNELSTGWKIFRGGCILQLIAVAYELISSLVGLWGNVTGFATGILSVIVYLLMFGFLYLGLSLINYNYPDVSLSASQKRNFNWLFILNILAIVLLFARLVSVWKAILPLLFEEIEGTLIYLNITFILLLPFYLFVFHLIFIVGMYRLRVLIHKNTVEKWEGEFGGTN